MRSLWRRWFGEPVWLFDSDGKAFPGRMRRLGSELAIVRRGRGPWLSAKLDGRVFAANTSFVGWRVRGDSEDMTPTKAVKILADLE